MKNLERLKKAVDQTVNDWNKTRLNDIEKWSTEELIIWGIVKAALYVLNFDDYDKLKQYIYDKYGYNVGGVNTQNGRKQNEQDHSSGGQTGT